MIEGLRIEESHVNFLDRMANLPTRRPAFVFLTEIEIKLIIKKGLYGDQPYDLMN
jgi:hypothetical protein